MERLNFTRGVYCCMRDNKNSRLLKKYSCAEVMIIIVFNQFTPESFFQNVSKHHRNILSFPIFSGSVGLMDDCSLIDGISTIS